MYELTIISDFSSAHNLRCYEGECEKLHGHNWKVEVSVESKKLDTTGLAIDFKVLKEMLEDILKRMDHKYLNEIPPFDKENPSSENIARYIYQEFEKVLSNPPIPPLQKGGKRGLKTTKVKVWESENAAATYYEGR